MPVDPIRPLQFGCSMSVSIAFWMSSSVALRSFLTLYSLPASVPLTSYGIGAEPYSNSWKHAGAATM